MSKRGFPWPVLLYGGLLAVVWLLPGRRQAASPLVFLLVMTLALAVYLIRWGRRKGAQAAGDILTICLVLVLAWELSTTKFNLLNPIVAPTPEDVFQAFLSQRARLGAGVLSSLELLAVGFAIALPLGVGLGMLVGWIPRLKRCLFPIAKVLSPVPPSIYSPYIIAIMPTFRSASAMVLVLGLFWPTFLSAITQVGNMDRNLLDSARALKLSNGKMMLHVLLPYLAPSVISSLHVRLSSSFLLLTLAEMMGASSGMGYFVRNNADYANYPNVVAGILMVGLVVTLLNGLITWMERKLIPWK